ncbi:cysteine peptidase family C39 domain-containing protein [[Acholeplasma] multilocale]|uniref:cysteine peptidase family C39 domain-containing protein n=1 Tax=[Acholeplasma] multilocale TaxID=264638 RepID=UPI00047D0B5B|nr:cysteine peptidase family C39 domain-containing protein [[Acholeplasma] multilocale]
MIEHIKQNRENDCGIACAAMLINHFQKTNYKVEDLNKHFNLNENGSSFFDLIEVLKKFDILGTGYYDEEIFLKDINDSPMLVYVGDENFHHYIIVYRKGKRIIAHDPGENYSKEISLIELNLIFKNRIITFKCKCEKMQYIEKLKPLIKNNFWSIIFLTFIRVFKVIIFMIESKFILSYITMMLKSEFEISIAIYFLVIFIIGGMIVKLETIFTINIQNKIKVSNLERTYNIISKRHSIYETVNLYKDFNFIADFEMLNLIKVITNILPLFLCIAFCWYINDTSLYLILLIEVFIILLLITFKNRGSRACDTNSFVEILTNIHYYQKNGLESYKIKELKHKLEQHTFVNVFKNLSNYLSVIFKVADIPLMVLFFFLFKSDIIDIFDIIIVLLMKTNIRKYFSNIANMTMDWQKYRANLYRLNKEYKTQKRFLNISKISSIEFVQFCKREDILKEGLSKKIRIGEVIVVNHEVEDYILKLNDDYFGRIIVNDLNLKEISGIDLRQQIKVIHKTPNEDVFLELEKTLVKTEYSLAMILDMSDSKPDDIMILKCEQMIGKYPDNIVIWQCKEPYKV